MAGLLSRFFPATAWLNDARDTPNRAPISACVTPAFAHILSNSYRNNRRATRGPTLTRTPTPPSTPASG
ncbi:hypothetical protein ACFQV2_34355 [Actinokineospora soli]|uniref:Uncharacterized protein n=1 Tax=Actinokineospora soli TaxID=1048753 RepID=A0ABW2TXU9_9PSEU